MALETLKPQPAPPLNPIKVQGSSFRRFGGGCSGGWVDTGLFSWKGNFGLSAERLVLQFHQARVTTHYYWKLFGLTDSAFYKSCSLRRPALVNLKVVWSTKP